ncbi:hypothetical protein AOLI_G00042700 [Acnodon oligacanthus]
MGQNQKADKDHNRRRAQHERERELIGLEHEQERRSYAGAPTAASRSGASLSSGLRTRQEDCGSCRDGDASLKAEATSREGGQSYTTSGVDRGRGADRPGRVNLEIASAGEAKRAGEKSRRQLHFISSLPQSDLGLRESERGDKGRKTSTSVSSVSTARAGSTGHST